ncbi:MAG: hypothetical protein Q4C43_02910 [Prevotella sp.]|nr:hypothetical protein [Prevotella sp.]
MNNNGKISRFWMSLVGILFCVSGCKADDDFTFETDKITPVEFETGKIVSDGIEMPYRVAHINGTGKPSLVIYLHGGSSKGNDNEIQMSEAGVDSIANYLESRQIEAIYLVPQCPSDKSWGGPMLGILKSLIDKYVGDGIVDENSLYILGGSMGGTGTWSMLSAYPGLFTAAMPVAGNPSKCDADKVASTPVCTVMGTSDRIMSVETTSDFINELNARNGITKFEVEDGWTHEMTCIQSYTTHRLDWVFSHGSNPSGIENPMAGNNFIKSVQYYSIDGRILSEPPSKGLYIIRCVNKDGSGGVHRLMMVK